LSAKTRKQKVSAKPRSRSGQTRSKPGRPGSRRRGSSSRVGFGVALAVAGAVAAAAFLWDSPGEQAQGGGDYAFVVGSPGPGEPAPDMVLPATDGSTFDLASFRGETVLLYFQEGLMCQPCWDQLTEIESRFSDLSALGVDRIATITTDPLDLLAQKAADEGLTTPVLADRDLAVSDSYSTTSFGMMGDGFNGHSFILVGPDGTILWRADYGGPPDHTMYLPVSSLLEDMRRGLDASP